jgi:hypothetical protein
MNQLEKQNIMQFKIEKQGGFYAQGKLKVCLDKNMLLYKRSLKKQSIKKGRVNRLLVDRGAFKRKVQDTKMKISLKIIEENKKLESMV